MMITGYYSNEQVAKLLEQIKSKIPINTYHGNAIRKFIDEKLKNIDNHI